MIVHFDFSDDDITVMAYGHITLVGTKRTLSSRDYAKAQFIYLIPSITSLMSGLTAFLSNPRQKFYSFDAETASFGFRIH